MIIVVEGSIAAGKTNFCADLYKKLSEEKKWPVVFIPEPLERWTSVNGENLLKSYYEDKARWALTFQSLVLATNIQNELHAVSLSRQGTIVIMERSSYSAAEIFTELLSEVVFTPAETKVLQEMKTVLRNPLQDHHYVMSIYLNTPPDICGVRIVSRGRPEEKGRIDFDYLQRLHRLHEKKMRSDSVYGILLVVDGSSYEKGAVERAKLIRPYTEDGDFYRVLTKYISVCTVMK